MITKSSMPGHPEFIKPQYDLTITHLRPAAEATRAVGACSPVVAGGVGPLEDALLARHPE